MVGGVVLQSQLRQMCRMANQSFENRRAKTRGSQLTVRHKTNLYFQLDTLESLS
jgi:hypothetical protein